MDGHLQGRSLGRGRARGLSITLQEAVPFFQRRGIGLRHRASPPAPGDRDADETADPDAGSGRVGIEAMMQEVALVPGSRRSPPSNDNGSDGSNDSNDSPNGSGGSHSPEDDSNVGDDSQSLSTSSTRSDETANTGGIGRGIRPDILDLVITRSSELVTKQGFSGTQIDLVANYFQLQHKKNWALRQYRVDVKPEEDQTHVRKRLVRLHRETLPVHIFDGTVLITYEPLSPEPLLLNSENNGINYVVEIRFIKEFASGDPITYQFYNLMIRKAMQELGFDLMGRHYYDSQQSITMLNWRLELYPGYMTSMRRCEDDVLLNAEVTHKMIRKDSVFHLMKSVKEETRRNTEEMRAKITQLLVGRIVMTNYNRKTYRVDGIDWDQRADGSFQKKRGDTTEQITFKNYYREKYGIDLVNRDQPLLISMPRQSSMRDRRGDQSTILLIPELCFITGLDEDQRANFKLMKDMSQHLHMIPERRAQTLGRFINKIISNREIQADMNKWGVRFLPELAKVPGRTLPSERLKFGEGMEQDAKADWSMAFRSQKMFSTPELGTWCLIVPQRLDRGIDNLIQTLKRVSGPLGYRINSPELVHIPTDRPQSYAEAIDNIMTKYHEKIQMIFVILAHGRIELYSAVKKRISVDYGIPSQCFLAKNVGNKGLMSIATKVVIQMCAKQGGEPWSVPNPLKDVMVVGFDVYHSAGRKGKSVGAMACTYSNSLARYFSTVSFFSTQDELAENMATDILKCLTAYKRMNGRYPKRIIFYRDGVGEGQLNYVFSSELEQMKNIIKKVYTGEGVDIPKLTFIVVNKRINTRLFMTKDGNHDNPPPGTVVDSVITLPERYDFFLTSQSVRQGTVSPCSYNVLYDSSGLSADKIQMYTYKLCHVYFNWSGTVGVPSPCQYAHKLAYLTGLALGNPAHQRLQFLLHYL